MMRGRRIAFDFGTARIGVAVCDPDGLICTPLPAIKADRYLAAITALIHEYEPVSLFVGNPLHLSGEAGESSLKAKAFAQELATFGIPVHLVDERLSTKVAAKSLSEAGHSARAQKSLIDSASAVAILELGLARHSS